MIADHIKKVAPSGIREFFDLVLGMPDVISLGVGEPDYITPWRIREKAITALEQGYTSYTSNKGLLVLRQGLSAVIRKKCAVSYCPQEEILITVGVSEGLDLAIRAILNPGEKVIIPSPHYVAYPALVEIAGGVPLVLKTRQQDNFKINPVELEALLRQKPKAIILNYPSNPTGVTYSEKELRVLWKLIAPTDTLVITDEAYDALTYTGAHVSFASLNAHARARTIMLNGFSKTYAMTGFRVAYACAHKDIIAAMTKIHAFSMLCGPIISQVAATEALRSQHEVGEMKHEYQRRRNFMFKELNRIGFSCHKPEGAFYCFPRLKGLAIPALDFAKRLLFKEKVAIVPGTAFGGEYADFFRMSYATSFDNLKEAVLRMERFIQTAGYAKDSD